MSLSTSKNRLLHALHSTVLHLAFLSPRDCTNPGPLVSKTTKFCESSVWSLLHVAVLGPSFWGFQIFGKYVHPCLIAVPLFVLWSFSHPLILLLLLLLLLLLPPPPPYYHCYYYYHYYYYHYYYHHQHHHHYYYHHHHYYYFHY